MQGKIQGGTLRKPKLNCLYVLGVCCLWSLPHVTVSYMHRMLCVPYMTCLSCADGKQTSVRYVSGAAILSFARSGCLPATTINCFVVCLPSRRGWQHLWALVPDKCCRSWCCVVHGNQWVITSNFERRGWKEVVDDTSESEWDIYWASIASVRAIFSPDSLVRLRPGQLINHFPNHYELTRKVRCNDNCHVA